MSLKWLLPFHDIAPVTYAKMIKDSSSPEEFTRVLFQALCDARSRVRWAAAETLVVDSPPEILEKENLQKALDDREKWIAPLLEALRDKYTFVQMAAGAALKAIGDPGIVAELIDMLRDNSLDSQPTVAHVIGELADESAVPGLVQTLHSDDANVREWAIYALEKVGHSSAVQALTDALFDPSIEIRRSAVFALGEIGSAEAVPHLRRVYHEPDLGDTHGDHEMLRVNVVTALGKIGDVTAAGDLVRAFDEFHGTRFTDVVVRAMARLGDRLEHELNDELMVMQMVLRLISFLDTLEDATYEDDHQRWRYASETVEALEKIGTPEALDAARKWRATHPGRLKHDNANSAAIG